MRRTTPDLVGSRATVYRGASAVLLGLTVGYVLWTNYVVFVGGNLPLTPISLGEGSTGAGLFMLPVGDLIAVLALWFLIDGLLLNALHAVLRVGQRSYATLPSGGRPAAQSAPPFAPPFAPHGGPPPGSPFGSPQPGGPAGPPPQYQPQPQYQPYQPQQQYQAQPPYQPQQPYQQWAPAVPEGPPGSTIVAPPSWPPPPGAQEHDGR